MPTHRWDRLYGRLDTRAGLLIKEARVSWYKTVRLCVMLSMLCGIVTVTLHPLAVAYSASPPNRGEGFPNELHPDVQQFEIAGVQGFGVHWSSPSIWRPGTRVDASYVNSDTVEHETSLVGVPKRDAREAVATSFFGAFDGAFGGRYTHTRLYGWPCASMTISFEEWVHDELTTRVDYPIDGILLDKDRYVGYLGGRRCIPTNVVWAGLLSNWGLATLAFLIAIGAIYCPTTFAIHRRRVRSSRCVRCGYSVVDCVSCPECGRPIRSRLPSDA